MKFYYTTSAGSNTVQTKPSLSLGGFKSSSPTLNDETGNLFDEITPYTLTKNKNEYIALMLVNETGGDVTNVEIWFEFPADSYSKYQVAGVIPAVDGDGNSYIERIETRTSKPFYADFVDAEVGSKNSLGNMLDGAQLGIWIKRELLIDFIETDSCDVYEEDLDNPRQYIPKEKSMEDIINVKLSWN
jgi:hypothetical protein